MCLYMYTLCTLITNDSGFRDFLFSERPVSTIWHTCVLLCKGTFSCIILPTKEHKALHLDQHRVRISTTFKSVWNFSEYHLLFTYLTNFAAYNSPSLFIILSNIKKVVRWKMNIKNIASNINMIKWLNFTLCVFIFNQKAIKLITCADFAANRILSLHPISSRKFKWSNYCIAWNE